MANNKRQIVTLLKSSVVEPEFLGVNDCEVVSGISRWTWRAWAYRGRIASSKVGRRLLIPVSELRRVMADGMRPRTESQQGEEGRCTR